MISQRVVVWLVVAFLGLPIALCVLYALGRLLEAMGDLAGADALGRVDLALFALWALDMVALVVVQAINSLGNPPQDSADQRQGTTKDQ